MGAFGGFQFMLQDQGGNTLTDLDRAAHQIVNAGGTQKDLTGLFTTFSANDPQELVTIDREKAKAMGISALADHQHAQRLHGIGVHQRL